MKNIASINATRSGKYYCTVLEESRGDHLQGSFCVVPIDNGYFKADALCRAGNVNTSNPAHENVQFQPLIAKRGSIEYISGLADVEQIVLAPIAFVDAETGQPIGSKGNPKSGTLAHIPEQGELDKFRREFSWYFNAGYMPGHPEVMVSLVNRDYGIIANSDGIDAGGYGEARHRIYAGKNGSGKTVFVLQAVCARAVAHQRMGVLMLDTKGDLVIEGKHIKPGFRFDPHALLRDAGRLYEIVEIRDIRLTSPAYLIDHLADLWAPRIGKRADIVGMVLRMAVEQLMGNDEEVDLRTMHLEDIINEMCGLIRNGVGWSVKGNEREAIVARIELPFVRRSFEKDWQRDIVPLYTGRYTARQIAGDVLENSAIRLVSMHGARDDHQTALVVEMLKSIKSIGSTNYYKGSDTNAEIILDEAPRWVPQERRENPYADIVVDAINTTRAYGISWTFCTQRLTAIDKNILAQCHTRYYCKGLGVGADLKHMEDDLGVDGVDAYRLLNLDNSYFCVVSGEELNFGSGGGHVAFVGWSGDVNAELKKSNSHLWKESLFDKVLK